MVIGVCNAAEPVDHEGLFAALGSIHAVLDQQGLASLYKQPIAPPAMVPAGRSSGIGPGRGRSVLCRSHGRPAGANPQPGHAGRTARGHRRRNGWRGARASSNDPAAMADGEQAVMDKIRRRVGEGAEVVCIIRDRNNPQAKSEVITLDRASPAFVNQLSSAGQPQNIPQRLPWKCPSGRRRSSNGTPRPVGGIREPLP